MNGRQSDLSGAPATELAHPLPVQRPAVPLRLSQQVPPGLPPAPCGLLHNNPVADQVDGREVSSRKSVLI
jgi:hypothetical protein